MEIKPENDGIDHLNVYSKGHTPLGRFLSNFAYSEINTIDGPFKSVEGYWYWLGTNHEERDMLRQASGYQAKDWGRQMKALDWQDTPEFKQKICAAIELKIRGNQRLAREFSQNELPLVHYYDFGGKVTEPEGGRWVLEFMNQLRTSLKNQYD